MGPVPAAAIGETFSRRTLDVETPRAEVRGNTIGGIAYSDLPRPIR